MTKRKDEVFRRLTHNKASGAYYLTVTPGAIRRHGLEKGHTLYFQVLRGILVFGINEDTRGQKIKLQNNGKLFYVNIPQKTIEDLDFKPHQQFRLKIGEGYVAFDPYTYDYGKTLIGVPEKIKKTVNNLPKFKEGIGCQMENSSLIS